MKIYFDHEKLKVYQEAISFVAWCDFILETLAIKGSVRDQLDRASTSIPLNIAEGNGKYSIRDRTRFLEIAKSSALESAACIDVMVAKKKLGDSDSEKGKEQLREIVSMLMGLMKTLADRVSEEQSEYGE